MANRVIQLQDKTGTDNLYPIAGGMAADSVTKAMLAEGVFEGETLSTPTDVDYVSTDNIQDGAVTPEKASFTTYSTSEQVVGTWIDGKTIYRKTLEQNYTVAANTAYTGQVVISPDSGTISEVVDFKFRLDDESTTNPGLTVDYSNYYNSSTNYARFFIRTQGTTTSLQIRVIQPQARTSKLTATVYYTKTTS